MTRLEMAADIEEHYSEILEGLKRYPQEIESPPGSIPYIRVVLCRLKDLDTFIRQLRAERVTAKEALNQTLVC